MTDQERIKQLEDTLLEVINSEEGHTSDSCWPYDVACGCQVRSWRDVLGKEVPCSDCGEFGHLSTRHLEDKWK